MIAARQALECMLGVPCEPMQSLEFAYYHAHLVDAGTAVIALSSSARRPAPSKRSSWLNIANRIPSP